MHDPGALRRGLVDMGAEVPETPKRSFGAGKAILIVLLMFVVGAGAGYGYFRLTKPTVHGDIPASTTAPAVTPSTTGTPATTVTPHALVPSTDGPMVAVVVPGGHGE